MAIEVVKRKYIHWTVKQKIWHMPCTICGSCGDTEIDHVVPLSRGGTDDISNLQPLCRYCNGLKGNRLTNDELKTRMGYGEKSN